MNSHGKTRNPSLRFSWYGSKSPCLREHGVAFLEEKDRGPHLSAGIQHYMLKPWDLKVVAQPLVFMRLVKDFQARPKPAGEKPYQAYIAADNGPKFPSASGSTEAQPNAYEKADATVFQVGCPDDTDESPVC
ncbi:hypothetical protein B0H19DRAFT_1064251 [Mycena capillaripes]|nr:hypothetical protein B0H19DRAFT_1064251 [Mycena capillaripes]